jgi:hypothetical protein
MNTTLKILSVAFILLLTSSADLLAQNTKGDQPAQKTRQARETRFKTRTKQGDRAKTKDIAGRRLRTKNKSSANRANANYRQPRTSRTSPKHGGDKVGKAIRPVYSNRPNDKQRAWKGNAAGNRINVRSATGRTRNVFPQKGPYVNNSSRTAKDAQQRMRAVKTQRVKVKSVTGKIRNVYPQSRKYKSSSKPYISRKSINPFAGFWNKKPKRERAYTGDITGRKLRTKNFETQRPKVIQPTTNPYYGRKKTGDTPYKGPVGGFRSRTETGKAWKGDITGRRIRGRNFSSKKSTEVSGKAIFPPKKSRSRKGDTPYKKSFGGIRSASQPGEKRTGKLPLPGKAPGIGAKGIDSFQGNMKHGKFFRPQGEEYSGNIRGRKVFTPQGATYSGNIKAKKPVKGGGSVSGKLWNNQGRAISGRYPGKAATQIGTWQGNIRYSRKYFSNQGEEYSGSLKARKPLKGGGSVSGKLWNNKGVPISGRYPGKAATQVGTWQGNIRYSRKVFTNQGEEYTGNIKARKPLKGGGSVSGKLWNNRETPIPGRFPKSTKESGYPGNYKMFDLKPSMRNQGEEYTGHMKAKKPLKGGGSVSGKLWNNDERPIPVKTFKGQGQIGGLGKKTVPVAKEPSKEIGGFPGKYRQFDLKPSMRNQGEEFTGYIKLSRFKRHYVKNPNSADEALRKARPDKSTYEVDKIYGRIKPYQYKHNPSSAKEALNVRVPGKAFARATDYQGNIKMKKFDLFGRKGLHPDAQFVKTNKNNVKEEKSMLTNFKLWWARLFRKNETQPDHLKEKIRKPRYDKGEQGLWYD